MKFTRLLSNKQTPKAFQEILKKANKKYVEGKLEDARDLYARCLTLFDSQELREWVKTIDSLLAYQSKQEEYEFYFQKGETLFQKKEYGASLGYFFVAQRIANKPDVQAKIRIAIVKLNEKESKGKLSFKRFAFIWIPLVLILGVGGGYGIKESLDHRSKQEDPPPEDGIADEIMDTNLHSEDSIPFKEEHHSRKIEFPIPISAIPIPNGCPDVSHPNTAKISMLQGDLCKALNDNRPCVGSEIGAKVGLNNPTPRSCLKQYIKKREEMELSKWKPDDINKFTRCVLCNFNSGEYNSDYHLLMSDYLDCPQVREALKSLNL